ncbi:CHAT domain-containing protein [Trichoderma afarasin]
MLIIMEDFHIEDFHIEDFHIDAELLSSLHEASEEDLQALAELHEDPANDDQIELYIYLCFLIFRASCNTQRLDQAIQRAEGWVAATAASHPDHNRRHSIMDTLVLWGNQYQAIKEDVRAELAPLEWREAPANTLDLPIRLQQTGRFQYLIQAIEKMKLALRTAGEYTTTEMLNDFGIMLGMRFERTGSTHDLSRAIRALSEVVNVTPHNHPNRAYYLCNFGTHFLQRFQQKGSIEDLNQAIRILSEAVDAVPPNHPDRASCLNNLGACLSERFHRIGSINDLDRAVDIAREAINITPRDNPMRVRYCINFGGHLGDRFNRTRSTDDLNQAISIVSEAVNTMPNGHPHRSTTLSNLGNFLRSRYEQTGSIDDLNQAISNSSEAVDALPYNHSSRADKLHSLGGQLLKRFRQTGSMDDYNRAFKLLTEAVDITALDDANHASRLFSLATCLFKPHTRIETLSMDSLDRVIPMFTTVWHSEVMPSRVRIYSACVVAKLLMLKKDWEQSYQILREAISLLHTASPRFSNRADAQALLIASFGLASSAVCAALEAGKAPEDALRLLEHGRGVIASLLMDMRGDITDLQHQYPHLAEKFSLLRDELDLPGRSATSLNSTDNFLSQELQISRYREANREFREVIDTIRVQPGFSSFLRPPDVKELMGASEQGPIIVLSIDEYRCDAFLIRSDSIQVIELPQLKLDEVQHTVTGLSGNSDFHPLLEWLWHTICHPCLNALGIKDAVSDDNWPHIWWIPTGLLSQLPLHAAGIYKQGSKETVLDRAISSYASSIKALLHGRKHGIQKPRQPPLEDSALIVSMQETPGLGGGGRLPFAADEVHMLRDLCPQLQLTPITPSRNKEDVLKHLPKCTIFHFAGHGQSDPRDPSRSCLLLEDWEINPLTVGDIRESRLQDDPPFLAYLSACSTGANKVEELANEAIHLISAFQLSGFRHAIGALWEVSDKHCVDVARILYKTLEEEGMTDLAVSRGLHRAVRALRDGNADDVLTRDAKLVRPRPASQGVTDFFWVPYVHFGV